MRCSTSMLLNSKTGVDPGILKGAGGGGCTLLTYPSSPMLWKASDRPVPLARSLRGSGAVLPPLPPKRMFPIFLSKTPFPAFLRLEKRCESMLQNLECILFFSQKPKNNLLIKKDSCINNSYFRFSTRRGGAVAHG